MKTLSLVFILICSISCNNGVDNRGTISKSDTSIQPDTINIDLNWQKDLGLSNDPDKDSIWKQPVSYYITNKNCSPVAVDFYYGRFRPSDNDSTEALLKLAVTEDSTLRLFYRWCLNKTIQIQDGALAEYTGVPARQYAENFPEEFFIYMDSDTTGTKYEEWVGSISYSGYYDNEDYQKAQQIREKLMNAMKSKCKNCDDTMYARIKKFANDCFDINLD